MKRNFIRQGDLLFIPKSDFQPQRDGQKLVETGAIAEGEATGHAHRLAVLDNAGSIEVVSPHVQ